MPPEKFDLFDFDEGGRLPRKGEFGVNWNEQESTDEHDKAAAAPTDRPGHDDIQATARWYWDCCPELKPFTLQELKEEEYHSMVTDLRDGKLVLPEVTMLDHARQMEYSEGRAQQILKIIQELEKEEE